ncbi:MAG: sugar phosphate nucleotidyltransferase [Bacillota bacterium]|nr:sugar phosphate nucleotidyltransferase [Bacillota bacterium]
MHLILLSGGSGKRLWPLSNDVRSKQFLQLLPAGDGTCESMVSRVYRQIREAGSWDSITVAASALQKDLLQLQLSQDVNIVEEPERRDTFPAIALACAFLCDKKGVPETDVAAVMPVDSFVEAAYFKAVATIPEVLQDRPESLALLGATPSQPSEKYGYIVPQEPGAPLSRVKCFREKPNAAVAKQLMAQGALWNCGVFGLRLQYVLDILRNKYGMEDVSYKSVLENFGQLNKISFDYEVVEKARDIWVIRYKGSWKDLGSWETLTEEMATPILGRSLMDSACESSHVINELDIPVIGMGLKNMVVAAGRDGILVAEKGETHRLKDFVGGFRQRPMFEEKRWGTYEVLGSSFYAGGTEALTKKLTILEGLQISYQYHQHRKELWTILAGEGLLLIEGEKRLVGLGDVVRIDEGMKHGIKALKKLELIEVQLGSPLLEEDIVRLDENW